MSSGQNSSTQSPITPEQQIFSDHERDVTGYLFAKLMVLYANSFYLVYPSEKEVKFAKREYAKEIGRFSRDQIDIGLRYLAKLAISPERDNRIYREPNLPAILAMLDEVARPKHAHKQFDSAYDESTGTYRLEDQTAKQKRIEVGLKYTSDLMSLFTEPEPTPLTPEQILDNERLEKIRNDISRTPKLVSHVG